MRGPPARAANVVQRDIRMIAHFPENPGFPVKNFRSVEFDNIRIVHDTYTIVRDDSS